MWKINGFVSLPWTQNVLCNMRCHYKIRNVRENYESRKIQSKSRMWSAESKPKWHNVYWKLEMLKKYLRQYSYETDRCSQHCVQTRIQCSLSTLTRKDLGPPPNLLYDIPYFMFIFHWLSFRLGGEKRMRQYVRHFICCLNAVCITIRVATSRW